MSAFKTLMNIIFPLITFPYASNVLQVENLGKVNFASSVCGYFLLFAGLGISSYAVREGSRYVNDREKLSAFASEMFSINMISTALTYAVLAVTMLFWTKLHAYTDLMLVLSLQIFFTTIGTEWVFTIFEEYTYITIRGLLFQVLSIFMLLSWQGFYTSVEGGTVIPTLTVCREMGMGWLTVVYGVCLLLCLISTGVTTTFGFVARFEKLPLFRKITFAPARSAVVAAFIIVLSMTISLVGLSNIIKYGYGYCGYLGIAVVVIPFLTVGVYKNRKYCREHAFADAGEETAQASRAEIRPDTVAVN